MTPAMRPRSLGFATALMVLRAGGSSIELLGDHLVVRSAAEPRYWWGNFVLVDRADQVEEGVACFRQEFPGARHVAIGVDGTDGALPPSLGALGLEPDVGAVLTARALAAPPRVEARVRVLTGDADWTGLFQLRLQGDLGPPDASFHHGRVATARRLAESGAGIFLGASRDGQLVSSLGIVSDGAGTARFQDVQTHPEHRRQGLAGHLVATAARMAIERWAVDRLVIVADPDGPAIGLYRSLGFEQAEHQVELALGAAPSADPPG